MYLYSYPSIHGVSGLAVGGAGGQYEVHLEMTIQGTQRPRSSKFGDALESGNEVYLEIHLKTMIK